MPPPSAEWFIEELKGSRLSANIHPGTMVGIEVTTPTGIVKAWITVEGTTFTFHGGNGTDAMLEVEG